MTDAHDFHVALCRKMETKHMNHQPLKDVQNVTKPMTTMAKPELKTEVKPEMKSDTQNKSKTK